MAYTDQTKISNYLQRALTQYEIDLLVMLLPAIKIWIDLKTGTTFDIASETTRYYDGGLGSVDIDPVSDVTTISLVDNDNTVTEDYTLYEDYVLEPQNSNVKTEIVRRHGSWPVGNRRIAVTGKFSSYDGSVPEDIQLLATRLAALFLTSGNFVSTSNIESESLEGHSIKYQTNTSQSLDDIALNDPMVKSILDLRKEVLIG